MLGGLDTQGLWKAPYGFPPNQTFFEWRQVTAVDTATGVITLDRPLSNTYLSTWPNYNQGSNFEADNGGPATIWAVDDTWNSTVEYRGLTINQEGQTYSPARHVTYRGVTFGGGHGGIPTQNETWSAINTSFANVNMEIDKLIGTMTMDGVTIKQIVFQSSSTDLFVMKNSTVTNRLDGGGKAYRDHRQQVEQFWPRHMGLRRHERRDHLHALRHRNVQLRLRHLSERQPVALLDEWRRHIIPEHCCDWVWACTAHGWSPVPTSSGLPPAT